MRESLGWVTSCSQDQACPQNWLEHPVTEIPRSIDCHVCGREVALVEDAARLGAQASAGAIAAFPVVPPIALRSAPSGGSSSSAASRLASTAIGAEDAMARGSIRDPTPVPARRQWVCTLASGESVRIDKPSMSIGRSRACDIVIPSAKVSRQHATVTLSGGELWIEDLGSSNGVWHDGEKITRTKVANGDTFTISDETLLFEVR